MRESAGGNGLSITTRAGDTRLANCRSDLSGRNGFYIHAPFGQYLGMVQLANCSTQRNMENGIAIVNETSGKISPVYLTGCVFQGDGRKCASNAGIRLSGPVMATITGRGLPELFAGLGIWRGFRAISTHIQGLLLA